jgi:hypothetical protein
MLYGTEGKLLQSLEVLLEYSCKTRIAFYGIPWNLALVGACTVGETHLSQQPAAAAASAVPLHSRLRVLTLMKGTPKNAPTEQTHLAQVAHIARTTIHHCT